MAMTMGRWSAKAGQSVLWCKAEMMGRMRLLQYCRSENLPAVSFVALALTASPAFLPGIATAQPLDSVAFQPSDAAVAQPDDAAAMLQSDISPLQAQTRLQSQSTKVRTDPHRSGFWLEPRLTVQHTATSNVRLDAMNSSDQVTEVMPGFRLLSDTARIKGFVDYSLRAAHYAKKAATDKFWHDLNAKVVVEAVEDRFFIDLYGIASLQPISVFGAPGADTPANRNMAQTSIFGLSPYLKGRISSDVDYEARYSVRDVRTDADNRSDITTHDWLLHVGSRNTGRIVGWAVDATQQTADFSSGRRIDTTALRGRISYAITPQLRIVGIGGVESSNQLSPNQKSHDIVGFGGNWQPSERTRLLFERESRYFGESHNVEFEHRTPRTVWRYTDRRSITNGLGMQSASLGSLYDLLDGFYARLEPNPVRRAQLVLADIERRGLPANMQVFQDFLTSENILQRVQQLSFALLGQRSSLTMAISRTDSRRLEGSLNLGDDFATNTQIRQRGWSLMLAHRLTVNSSIHASIGEMRSVGSVPGLETRVRPLVIGWSTLLTRRTNTGLQLRRVLSDGSTSRYDESAIMGFITHRF